MADCFQGYRLGAPTLAHKKGSHLAALVSPDVYVLTGYGCTPSISVFRLSDLVPKWPEHQNLPLPRQRRPVFSGQPGPLSTHPPR